MAPTMRDVSLSARLRDVSLNEGVRSVSLHKYWNRETERTSLRPQVGRRSRKYGYCDYLLLGVTMSSVVAFIGSYWGRGMKEQRRESLLRWGHTTRFFTLNFAKCAPPAVPGCRHSALNDTLPVPSPQFSALKLCGTAYPQAFTTSAIY